MKQLLYIIPVLYCSITHTKLSENDIQAIYTQYIKPKMTEKYRNRHVPLPLHKNTLPWSWKGKDFPRVIALLEFDRFIKEHHITSEHCLAINGASDPELYYLQPTQIYETDYKSDPIKYDLHTLDLEMKTFDFVMLNQTLEHVYDPITCLKNIYKHTKDNGILYFNVPCINILHSTPFHFYTGFTGVGVGAIIMEAGFTILDIGQWGNVEYMVKLLSTNAWPDYQQLRNPGLNDIHHTPVIIWVFAIKKPSKKHLDKIV